MGLMTFLVRREDLSRAVTSIAVFMVVHPYPRPPLRRRSKSVAARDILVEAEGRGLADLLSGSELLHMVSEPNGAQPVQVPQWGQ